MGIKGLIQWIGKSHPEAVTNFKSRWASPEIRGKKVAIDATLMTNRFHFAIQDGPLKGKGGAMGWYNLISDMRSNGVHPVAIWDQRGVREWKAPEANKRLAIRALQLARRSHEDRRAIRLTELRNLMNSVRNMGDEQRNAMINSWKTDLSTRLELERSPEKPEQQPGKIDQPITGIPLPHEDRPSPETSRSQEVNPVIKTITSLMNQLFQSASSPSYKRTDKTDRPEDPILTLIEQERVLEEYEKHVSADREPDEDQDRFVQDGIARDIVSSPPEEVSSLDERLASLDVSGKYDETPRQKELTNEEREIIKVFLEEHELDSRGINPTQPETVLESDRPLELVNSELTSASPSLSSTSTPKESILSDAESRLDALITRAPEVWQIHDRALGQPTAQDHLDCQELLKKMGVPVLEASIPYEAEGMAASMAKAGLVDYVVSEDSDVLAYEAPLLRNASLSSKPLSLISGYNLRQHLSLTPPQFLDFCILLGTDASPRIPAVGPHRALKHIQEYSTIENLLDAIPKLKDRLDDEDGFWRAVANARWIFQDIPNDLLPSPGDLEARPSDEAEVERFMEDRWGIRLVDSRSGDVFPEIDAWNAGGNSEQGQDDQGVVDEWWEESGWKAVSLSGTNSGNAKAK